MTATETTQAPVTPASQREERQLVAAARERDETAIRELIRRLNPRLFRIARGIVDTDAEAEDIVQEAYLTAFGRLDEFRGESRFATWISRIVLNTARMRRRGQRTDTKSLDTVEEEALDDRVVQFPGSGGDDPYTRAGQVQVRQLLESAVTALPPELRVVFLLRESEGMAIGAIAQDLALNPITVKTRLFRARRRLRRRLTERVEGGFDQIFPFAGTRCAAMADRVVAGLFGRAPDR